MNEPRRPTSRMPTVSGPVALRAATSAGVDLAAAESPERARFRGFLRSHREARAMSLEEIARVTRVPLRSLEHLEDAAFESLPADVFVRGFLRSYARCVGLDVDEVIERYTACGLASAPVASPHAAALVDMTPSSAAASVRRTGAHVIAGVAPLASPAVLPTVLAPPVVVAAPPAAGPTVAVVVAQGSAGPAAGPPGNTERTAAPAVRSGSPDSSERRNVRRRGKRPSQKAKAARRLTAVHAALAGIEPKASLPAETAAVPMEIAAPAEIVAAPAEIVAVPEIITAEGSKSEIVTAPVTALDVAVPVGIAGAIGTGTGTGTGSTRVLAPPTLVIDDEDPERADQQRTERADRAQRAEAESESGWRSFLPQSLLDNDRRSRQGGLTLAVIILLIVATITLSYLMRRPSTSGEGVTQAPTSAPMPVRLA